MKERSKIIKDLIMDKINVLQAIESLNFMLEDIENEEIKIWVKNEINGYNDSDEKIIPDYRKVTTALIGDVHAGYMIYKDINIPFTDMEAFNLFSKALIKQPISEIMQLSKAETDSKEHTLCLNVNPIIVNKYKKISGTVINPYLKLSLYTYSNILLKIKEKLLDIFKELEKNYGNLDELYIDFSDINKRDKVLKTVINMVYNDKSIKIGDENVIKGSNIGDENEN